MCLGQRLLSNDLFVERAPLPARTGFFLRWVTQVDLFYVKVCNDSLLNVVNSYASCDLTCGLTR